MSGICGVLDFGGAPPEPGTLEEMAQAAAHRGPDGIRYWRNGGVGLAYLALDVIPESPRERQPLVSRGNDLVLTADARVDNREELVRNLSAKGYLQDRAPTDAGLILAAYRCWGETCPQHIIGDFAFAVWDAKRQRLFAARDAMGMRAFYYRVEPRRMLFATELKQILAAPDVPARLFEPAVGAYLSGHFGPLEWSFYEGISQLAPGHALVADEKGQRVWRYWDIDPDHRVELRTEEEYVERFREVFEEAVRCRLRSARPVGVLLSGGIDSGSIASTAGWLLRRDGLVGCSGLRAYSYAFEELPQCDERHISSGIVDHYGLPATDILADEAWPLEGYPAHGPDKDEPFIGVYQALYERALATAGAEGMGSVISGDRGDLMVGDVVFDHLGMLRAGELRALWDELRAQGRRDDTTLRRVAMSYLLRPLLFDLWPRGTEWVLEKRRGLRSHGTPPPYPGWVRPEFAERVGLDGFAQQNGNPRSGMSGLARRTRYELVFTNMHMRGVVWSERTQARFGLGFADPWSDRRLASFVLAAPQWRIQRVREPKRIARRAMRGIMPERVRREARKISPEPMYERALREQARDTVLDLTTDSRAAALGYIDEGALRDHYRSILGGGQIHPSLWWTLTLEMWLRQHWT